MYGYLCEQELLRARNNAEKFLLLAALNLVECVAYVRAPTDGIQAGVGKNYVKAGNRHVIASTTIIGDG